ncbi:MAG: aromatic ring-hydroxylating dioxygenase subunit alpha [Rhodospirillaceae bacterium]|nr:aromatic ring-hydroxylating dioxygenase subunit alpha [Rhodospirillaceae bacterium]
MIINTWYVAGFSDELKAGEPRPVRMLGHDFVLFRNSAGRAHCLSDTCIHRGGSLSRGKVVGDVVQCPYHGWRFNAGGACVEIPSLGAEATIPKRARVDSYPVQEKWGWVWVFLGDLPESQRPPVPADDFFPEFKDAQLWDGSGTGPYRIIHGTFLFNCNWMRAIDNVLDPAHPFHVHHDFGHVEDQRIKPFTVADDGVKSLSQHSFKSTAKRGNWRDVMADERPPTQNQLQFHMSGLVLRNDVRPNPGMHHVVFSAYLPVDEKTTLNIWLHARNFFTEAKYDADTIKRTMNVFEEDARVLNHVSPGISPRRLTHELFIEADAHIAAFRRQVRAYEEKGWMIDHRANAAEDDVARVIPSPARHGDAKNWVLDSCLMRPATAAKVAAAE